ncbi:MAG: hypothetical protein ACRETQ_13155 [Gammaproteobacteria bacterium]
MKITGFWMLAAVAAGGFGLTLGMAHAYRSGAAAPATQTIALARVVVTPADADPALFALTPVVVTPNLAEWRDAAVHERLELAALGRHLRS